MFIKVQASQLPLGPPFTSVAHRQSLRPSLFLPVCCPHSSLVREPGLARTLVDSTAFSFQRLSRTGVNHYFEDLVMILPLGIHDLPIAWVQGSELLTASISFRFLALCSLGRTQRWSEALWYCLACSFSDQVIPNFSGVAQSEPAIRPFAPTYSLAASSLIENVCQCIEAPFLCCPSSLQVEPALVWGVEWVSPA